HDDDFARHDLKIVVEQDLIAGFAFAEVVIDPTDRNGWRWRSVRRRCSWLEHGRAHGNTSAGSAVGTGRKARNPYTAHMPTVNNRINAARPKVMLSGMPVLSSSTV